MSKKVLILLADGFEEIEMTVPVDIFRRLGINVCLAGIENEKVIGAHDIVYNADTCLKKLNTKDFDAVLLPGGMPGAKNLQNSQSVIQLVKDFNSKEKLMCAICAAPIVFGKAGILENKTVTCYPGFETELGNVNYTSRLCEHDGNIITGKGPGAAFAFTREIAETLDCSTEKLYQGMFIN